VMTSGGGALVPWPDTGSDAMAAITAAKPTDATTRLIMDALPRKIDAVPATPFGRVLYGRTACR
jgi:hypothetical protein